VPDCILLDLHLGGMEYPEILKRCEALGLRVPVIAITGDTRDSPDAMGARAAGVVEVLVKPFRKAELREVVQRYCGRTDPQAGP
jgi:CheY-like chemotaxis protein